MPLIVTADEDLTRGAVPNQATGQWSVHAGLMLAEALHGPSSDSTGRRPEVRHRRSQDEKTSD